MDVSEISSSFLLFSWYFFLVVGGGGGGGRDKSRMEGQSKALVLFFERSLDSLPYDRDLTKDNKDLGEVTKDFFEFCPIERKKLALMSAVISIATRVQLLESELGKQVRVALRGPSLSCTINLYENSPDRSR